MEVKEILDQRQETYGEYFDVARTAQQYKDNVRLQPRWNELSYSQKESLDMIANKAARILNGNFKWLDSWYDIIGYVQLILNQEENKMDSYNVNIFGFNTYDVNLPKNNNMDEVVSMGIFTIVKSSMFCAEHPNNIKPWKTIKIQAQNVIDHLEEQGEKRIQH